MPATSQRVGSFSESVIRAMTRMANQHGAINLSQGFPDFDPPPELRQAAERAGREGPHREAGGDPDRGGGEVAGAQAEGVRGAVASSS